MQYDLAQLVKDALLILGCDPAMGQGLDSHSTITLDFEDLPSLLISVQDEQVWLWSRVAEYSETVLAHKASDILTLLMQSDDTLIGGHPSLAEGEGYLELRGVLTPAMLENGERMAEALTQFFDRLSALAQLIRQ
jgi:hypothetical protein